MTFIIHFTTLLAIPFFTFPTSLASKPGSFDINRCGADLNVSSPVLSPELALTIQSLLDEYHVPGLSVAVVDNGVVTAQVSCHSSWQPSKLNHNKI